MRTSPVRLARAAREFDCDLVLERSRDAEEARKRLVKLLRDDQVPVLLCVDEWTHWITVVGVQGNRFLVIDSEQDPVLTIHTWAQLRARWQLSTGLIEESDVELAVPHFDPWRRASSGQHLADSHSALCGFSHKNTYAIDAFRRRFE